MTEVSASHGRRSRNPFVRRRHRLREVVRNKVRGALPTGRSLTPDSWNRRHMVVVCLLMAHAAGIAWWVKSSGAPGEEAMATGAVFLVLALLSTRTARSRRFRSGLATVGLLGASAMVVQLSEGSFESLLHVFVVVGLLALYQDWLLFAIATGFSFVFARFVAEAYPDWLPPGLVDGGDPTTRALTYASMVGAASVAGIALAWLNEQSRAKGEEYYRLLYEGQRALVSQLQEAERLKEELVAVVSHELRTPLAAIMGFARTLQTTSDRLDERKRRDFLERIVRNSDRLIRLVENLLEASRTRTSDALSWSDLGEVIETLVREAEEAKLPEVQAARVVHGPIPAGAGVRMQEDALRLVLDNLVGNAQKFARPGTDVTIDVRLEAEESVAEEDSYISIAVTNRGEQIPATDRARIFEPFVQGDSSSTRSAGGVGLGLSIVRTLVESHKGWIELEGEGDVVTFRVVLPGMVWAATDQDTPDEAVVPPVSPQEPLAPGDPRDRGLTEDRPQVVEPPLVPLVPGHPVPLVP